MHNIDPEPNAPRLWPQVRVANDVAYYARETARLAAILVAACHHGDDGMVATYERQLTEKMVELNALHVRHFCAPTPASVQVVPRETKETAA